MHHPTDRITDTTAFVTTVVEHWLEQDYGIDTNRQHNIVIIPRNN